MHSHELSNHTYANGNVMTIKDMFCLRYFSFILVYVNTAFLLYGFVRMCPNSFVRISVQYNVNINIDNALSFCINSMFTRTNDFIRYCKQWRIKSFLRMLYE